MRNDLDNQVVIAFQTKDGREHRVVTTLNEVPEQYRFHRSRGDVISISPLCAHRAQR